MNYFSQNLKYLITRFAVTQSQLASYVGKSQNSISNWSHAASFPDVLDLIKIYRFFGVSIDSLIFEDLENGKVITEEHVREFKRIGKKRGKVYGKNEPISKRYFIEEDQPLSVVSEPDQVASWAYMGQFKQINEKLDQLRDIAEKLRDKSD